VDVKRESFPNGLKTKMVPCLGEPTGKAATSLGKNFGFQHPMLTDDGPRAASAWTPTSVGWLPSDSGCHLVANYLLGFARRQ
jgi:hypothetical protein